LLLVSAFLFAACTSEQMQATAVPTEFRNPEPTMTATPVTTDLSAEERPAVEVQPTIRAEPVPPPVPTVDADMSFLEDALSDCPTTNCVEHVESCMQRSEYCVEEIRRNFFTSEAVYVPAREPAGELRSFAEANHNVAQNGSVAAKSRDHGKLIVDWTGIVVDVHNDHHRLAIDVNGDGLFDVSCKCLEMLGDSFGTQISITGMIEEEEWGWTPGTSHHSLFGRPGNTVVLVLHSDAVATIVN